MHAQSVSSRESGRRYENDPTLSKQVVTVSRARWSLNILCSPCFRDEVEIRI
jgi:hypothetical protein